MTRRKFLSLPGLEVRPLGQPARNLPLYGLLYVLDSSLMYKALNPRSTSSDGYNTTAPFYILIVLLR
jgi:hypothetical protein